MKSAKKTVELLLEKNYHITFAESCTGGLAAGRLIDIPDASNVFDMSFVTYANEAKINLIGVSEELIKEYGVVSREVALSMAECAARKAGAQIGVGISGIAGPGGGTAEKSVGTVCFGFYLNGEKFSFCQHFGNIGRNNVREKSVDFVYNSLEELLK